MLESLSDPVPPLPISPLLQGRTVKSTDAKNSAPGTVDPKFSTAKYEPFCGGTATTSARGVRRRSYIDNLCRLTEIEVGSVGADDFEVANVSESRIFEYDDLGRLLKTKQGSASGGSVYGQAVYGTNAYGASGSASMEERSYVYDDFNKLISVSSVDSSNNPTNHAQQENSYNANGFRRKKKAKSGAVTTEYSAGLETAVARGAGDPISYIQGHHILGYEQGGSFYWFLTDALGTVRDVVDDAGDVLQSYEFDPHGNLMPGSGASSGTFAPKTFHGSLSVNDDRNDSGLYLMGHRHWDSTLSRFISRDPIGFKGGLNLFNGAGTTPVDRVDPTGLLPQKGEYPRVDEIFAEILRRADNEKCRKALEILATFCTDPQPVRTDFPKNNVLEGIFALSNVDLRLDPNGDPVKGYWNQPYSGVPGFPQGSTIQLAGDLGAVGS